MVSVSVGVQGREGNEREGEGVAGDTLDVEEKGDWEDEGVLGAHRFTGPAKWAISDPGEWDGAGAWEGGESGRVKARENGRKWENII